MCYASKARVARRVLEYLAERQDAQDTLEGIVEWWLVKQQLVEQTATVREALDELVAAGLLVSRPDPNARMFYSLNRLRAEDISTYLKTHSG
jgi:Fe2+ or Zn2+ uptake regulation protein